MQRGILAASLLALSLQAGAATLATVRGNGLAMGQSSLALKGADAATAGQAIGLIRASRSSGLNLVHLTLDRVPGQSGLPSEAGWQQVDQVMAEAARHRVFVILSLSSGRQGGAMEASAKALGGKDEGLYYTDGRAREWFLYVLRQAASRVNSVSRVAYKDDPTLLGWILASAVSDPDDPQGSRVAAWARQSAQLLKSMDSGHLIGLAWAGKGVPDFARLAGIDFISVPPTEQKRVAKAVAKPVLAWGAAGNVEEIQLAAPPAGGLRVLKAEARVLNGQEVEVDVQLSEPGLITVEYGLEGLLDKSLSAPRGRSARMKLRALKPGADYLARARAQSGQASAASPLFRIMMPGLARRSARPQAASRNIIVAKAGKFWDGPREFRFVGANNYYLRYNSEPGAMAEVLDGMREMGMRVLRCQANGEHFGPAPSPDPEPGRWMVAGKPDGWVEDSWRRYDKVMAEAAKRGLRVVVYVTDNWEYYGGATTWAKWFGKKKNAFYTDPQIKQAYKNLLKRWLTRVNSVTGVAYKDDPTVFAWELMNEPRNEDDTSSKTLAAWANEMAAYIKSLDPKHMVAAGLEGALSSGGTHYSGSDFTMVQASPYIDYATYHFYPIKDFRKLTLKGTLGTIKEYNQIARATLKKPVVMEEYGVEKKYEGELSRFEWTQAMAETHFRAGGQGVIYWQFIHKKYNGLDGFEFHRDDLEYFNLFSRLADEVNP